MAKIPRDELVKAFQEMHSAGDGYIPGTSGEVWTQARQDKMAASSEMVRKYGQRWVGRRVEDCSGAFVRAYKAFSLSIYHGSNRIAREYVEALLPPGQAEPGMAAFKAREPGQQLYDLPSEYKKGGKRYNGDLNDYYHIGLVDEDTRYVLNSQGTATGFQRSKMESGWTAVGRLKAVEYGNGDDEPVDVYLYEAIVDSANDKPVNLRKSPSVNSAIIGTVRDGTKVRVLNEVDADWAEIDTGTRKGYMMRGFLDKIEEPEDEAARLRRALEQIIEIAQYALQEGGD